MIQQTALWLIFCEISADYCALSNNTHLGSYIAGSNSRSRVEPGRGDSFELLVPVEVEEFLSLLFRY
jgi:hypothetical protein